MFEINLVPDVKAEMLKTQKMRNLVVAISIVIVAVAGGVIAILGGIKGGQDITMSSQDRRLENMSKKLSDFDDLDELIAIQNQLNGLETIAEKKVLLSRIFSIVKVLMPTNGDSITLSEMNVDVENSTLKFDAQADAKTEPLIDYRVLEEFKKNTALIKYDFGRYVDEKENKIPTVCIVETNETGNTFNENGSIYAIWTKGVDGCDPSKEERRDEAEITATEVKDAISSGDSVKVWRTPQFESWYESKNIDDSGEIKDIPHFASECTTYSRNNGRWSSSNTCDMIPEEIKISDSSNARDSSGSLVLRFSASIKYNPEVLLAKNKHMIAVGPTGYSNVTDSYMQIEGMFKKRADDCAENDKSCASS